MKWHGASNNVISYTITFIYKNVDEWKKVFVILSFYSLISIWKYLCINNKQQQITSKLHLSPVFLQL